MNTINYLWLVLLSFSFSGFSQSQVDSLSGVYVGNYYFKLASSSAWTINSDTAYVNVIDTNNCKVSYSGTLAMTGTGVDFNTNYSNICYFANPINLYTYFYAIDSFRVVYDNIATPPPNVVLQSRRFYGKRIGQLPAKVTTVTANHHYEMYPNPFEDFIIVKGLSETAKISIKNYLGQTVYEAFPSMETFISTSQFSPNLYWISIIDRNTTFQKILFKK